LSPLPWCGVRCFIATSSHNSRSGKGDFGGAGWGVLSQQSERRDAKPAPVTPPAGSQGSLWQVSRRPLARSCFAGRSRPRWSSLGGSSLTRQFAPLGHSLRRADPPAARSPVPGNTGPAAPGRPAAPVLPFVKLSPVPPRQASGWHPLRRGGDSGPNLAPAVICFGCHPHTCAQGLFLLFWGSPQPSEQKHRQKFS
jgi:hypothetical protein